MKTRTQWLILWGSGLLLLGVAVFVYVPYRVADAQYEQLVRLQPKTRQEVERTLRFYMSKPVAMEKSLWGREHTLGEHEVCVQYLILAREPIEVVYGPNDEVRRVFASYE
jgi:hypothetical protein